MGETIRVFLSSPGDVADERGLARQVIRRLAKERLFFGKIVIEEVSWDDPDNPVTLDAHYTPQKAIELRRPKPSECDVVVVILWSRLGTPLPDEYRKPDGKPYRSGTEWEFLDAVNSPKPAVWVYWRTERVAYYDDDPELDAKRMQRQAVKDFLGEFQTKDGALLRSVNHYPSPSEFARLFESSLRDWLTRRLEAQNPPAAAMPVAADAEPATGTIWKDNPYRGLEAFGEQHRAIFFGRGLETDELVQRVRDGVRVLAVVGASGSGKSSLVAAGLLPRLADGAVPGSRDWVQVRFTPAERGDDPFRALALALLPSMPMRKRRTAQGISRALAWKPALIHRIAEEILAGRPATAELLLFADQFEELFTARVAETRRSPFVALLEACAASPRVRVVLSLRSDYYGHCTAYEGLAHLLQKGSFPLAAPTGRALTEIIEGPARVAGLTLQPGLVDVILKDAGEGPGRLALVEFALAKLYDLRRDSVLSIAAYREQLGGVSGAIQGEGDKAVEGASPAALGEVFDALSEVDERGGAVRKRAYKQDLSPQAQILVKRLEDARLLTADRDPDSAGGRTWVEVAHEAVLGSWPKFKSWLDEFGAFKRWRNGLNEARRRWLKLERDPSELLRGPRLKEALLKRRERPEWLTKEENDYIRRSLRHRRWTAFGLAAAFVVPALLVWRYFWWVADQQLTHTVVYRLILARVGIYEPLRPEMVRIPPEGECPKDCTFQMGSPPEQCWERRDECPQHPVAFAKPFLMGRYEVTFDDWDVFRRLIDEDGGCRITAPGTNQETPHELPPREGQDQGWGRGHRPVINVSWDDARCYIDWLNRKLQPEHPYRLPTEAEWEYAARAGSPKDWFWGDDPEQAKDHAWFKGNSKDMTHPVDKDWTRNGYGLYDIAGNVEEWTEDCWHENYNNAPADGSAWIKGDGGRRVIRGGSWFGRPDFLRSAARLRSFPVSRIDYLGFRLAQDLQ